MSQRCPKPEIPGVPSPPPVTEPPVTPPSVLPPPIMEAAVLEIGMIGLSLEAISAGDQGYAAMPVGARDLTKMGGRKWVRIQVRALEDVGANNLIIVCNEQLEVKESFELEILGSLDYQKPIPKASLFNVAIAANTNFLAKSISPTNTPCIFRIYVALDTAGVFSVQRTSAATTITENMNQGIALAANSAYIFDILVDEDETVNFQTTVAATILKLSVAEKDDAK